MDTINHKKITLEMFAKCSSVGESRMQIKDAKLHYEIVGIGERFEPQEENNWASFLRKYDTNVRR
jgi:hypothetical protein